MKELGYDIEKDAYLLYIDGEGTLQTICDDHYIVGTNQLRTNYTTDIYIETS